MAANTSVKLRNMIIYEVYVRNHGETGTFEDVRKDLKRIKDMGTDIIWFMPIHPIGEKNKKGSLGCPYSIKNYREVNPEYGTLEDFKALINEIHEMGMLVMIDIVFNHTSRDSYLLQKHPEYFYRKPDGEIGNKVGDWYDIADLDYNNKDLWKEQIDVLKYWAKIGVDGFRCDVAPLVPIEFWMEARKEVAKVKENVIWLSETCHPSFIMTMRRQGLIGQSDSEIYNAFDITYDYDAFQFFERYLEGETNLEGYLEKVRQQEYIYPANYVKLRFLENHDIPRARKHFKDEVVLRNWTAFLYFQKGATLIYGGQETRDDKTPSLFDIDKVDWSKTDEEFVEFMKKLGSIKKREIFAYGNYDIHKVKEKNVIYATYEYNGEKIVGIFNVEKQTGKIEAGLKDGIYTNFIDGKPIEVVNGQIELNESPLIFQA
jgi:glycosidase